MNQNDILRIRFNRGIEAEILHGAMDQHAKNITFAFILFLRDRSYSYNWYCKKWTIGMVTNPALVRKIGKTDEELYDLFIESLNNK